MISLDLVHSTAECDVMSSGRPPAEGSDAALLLSSNLFRPRDAIGDARPSQARLASRTAVALAYGRLSEAERQALTPYFDREGYLERHPDVRRAGMDPLVHFLRYGAGEGRTGWLRTSPPSDVWVRLRRLLPWPRPAARPCLRRDRPVQVCASSVGNFFFTQIQTHLVAALREAGLDARAADERSLQPGAGSIIVVAPHEFFYLGDGPALSGRLNPADLIIYNAEQLHTSWFAKSFAYIDRARATLDISAESAALLRAMGYDARFLPPGYVRGFAPLSLQPRIPPGPATRELAGSDLDAVADGPLPPASRPIDVLFVGTVTRRRLEFLARNAAVFARFRCHFHLTSQARPITGQSGDGLHPESFAALAQRSKVLLNVHQSDHRFFEWQRMALFGFWQGCLVLSETADPVPHVVPGRHFVAARLEDLGSRLVGLLSTAAGRHELARVAAAGQRNFFERFQMARMVDDLLRA